MHYNLIDECTIEMIHILIRSNVNILDYVNSELLPINTWYVAVRHNIRNITRVPPELQINLAFYLIVGGYYSLYQFNDNLSYSKFTLLIDMFGQHYRTEMIENNAVRLARIIYHVPVKSLVQIILRYIYI